jgi:hypothetical protein
MGFSQHSGMVIVCDGTDEAAARIARVLHNDPATGVMRHADAGYEIAIDCAKEQGLNLPMIPATQGKLNERFNTDSRLTDAQAAARRLAQPVTLRWMQAPAAINDSVACVKPSLPKGAPPTGSTPVLACWRRPASRRTIWKTCSVRWCCRTRRALAAAG